MAEQSTKLMLPEWIKKNRVIHRQIPGTNYFFGCDVWYDTLCHEDKSTLWSNYYNGSLIVKGAGGTYTDWNGKEWPLYPGAFLQHLPNKYHTIRRDRGNDWCEICIWLPIKQYDAAVTLDIINPDVPVMYPGLDLGLLERFRRYQNHFDTVSATHFNTVVLEFLDFFETIRLRSHQQLSYNPLLDIVEEIEDQLNQKFEINIDIATLVERYPASYSNLQRLFKKHTSLSMGEFRLTKKMDMAAHYLVEYGLPIKEIAQRVGYSDRYAFSKQFKKIKGLTPKQYADQHQCDS